jgi:hypothetical protein
MLRLPDSLVRKLVSQPESGMGYQLVDVELSSGVIRGVAYNAELVLREEEPRTLLNVRVFETLLKAAEIREIIDVNVRGSMKKTVSAVFERAVARAGEAKDAPVEATAAEDEFRRFSAYATDRRRLADGSLSPGTYATTAADALNVKTGTEAVRRYALPDPAPASYVLTSRPAAKTAIQRGIVAPAYGQPGGGVEVIFPNGTAPSTTTGPDQIPD